MISKFGPPRSLDNHELDLVVGGFVLIELLVTINIITPLIALLLPPIQAAHPHPVHK